MNGAFRGDMDLSIRPLGKVVGTFSPTGAVQGVKFCGTFRLPFAISRADSRPVIPVAAITVRPDHPPPFRLRAR